MDARALENPTQTQRRSATYYDAAEVRLRLDFSAAYSGTLHLYALDWDNINRRQTVTVNYGTTTHVIAITGNFRLGAWMHVPISILAGGSVTIRATRTSGGSTNAVLAGAFLGPLITSRA